MAKPLNFSYSSLVESVSTDPDDPIAVALHTGVRADIEDLRDISASVRWHKTSRISLQTFHVIKALALMDLFTDYSAPEKMKRLKGWRTHTGLKTRDLSALRSRKAYKDVRKRLLDARERMSKPVDMKELVDQHAPTAVRRLEREMVRGTNPKQAVAAATAFVDRALPRPQSSTGRGAGFFVPADIMHGHVQGMAIVIKKLDEGKKPIQEIEGEVVGESRALTE